MLSNLKGGTLWAVVLLTLGVIGACTALAYNGTLSGDLWLAVITPIIAGLTGVTAAHVTGNQVAAALNTPAPGLPSVPPAAVAPGPVSTVNSQPAAQPAMPTGG
jgi:hypothetical protein